MRALPFTRQLRWSNLSLGDITHSRGSGKLCGQSSDRGVTFHLVPGFRRRHKHHDSQASMAQLRSTRRFKAHRWRQLKQVVPDCPAVAWTFTNEPRRSPGDHDPRTSPSRSIAPARPPAFRSGLVLQRQYESTEAEPIQSQKTKEQLSARVSKLSTRPFYPLPIGGST